MSQQLLLLQPPISAPLPWPGTPISATVCCVGIAAFFSPAAGCRVQGAGWGKTRSCSPFSQMRSPVGTGAHQSDGHCRESRSAQPSLELGNGSVNTRYKIKTAFMQPVKFSQKAQSAGGSNSLGGKSRVQAAVDTKIMQTQIPISVLLLRAGCHRVSHPAALSCGLSSVERRNQTRSSPP